MSCCSTPRSFCSYLLRALFLSPYPPLRLFTLSPTPLAIAVLGAEWRQQLPSRSACYLNCKEKAEPVFSVYVCERVPGEASCLCAGQHARVTRKRQNLTSWPPSSILWPSSQPYSTFILFVLIIHNVQIYQGGAQRKCGHISCKYS